jgi:uncharacterized protein involved in exopolysaccharide biosynthesis
MSRIEDGLKQIADEPGEPHPSSVLERFAPEKWTKLEGTRRFTFVPVQGSSPHAAEAQSSNPQAATASATQLPWPAVASLEEPDPEAEPRPRSAPLVNIGQAVDYIGFLTGSVRRHTMLATGTFLMALGMTAAAAVLLPRTYHVQTKLLAQRNAVMAALSNPGRAVPWDADAPTRAAAETVLRRDNLILLINQTDLVRDWDRTRTPLLKLKDWLVTAVTRYTPDADDKLEALVSLLEARMVVVAGPVGDGTVTIDLDWPDPEMAYRLVQAAQQAFLDARQQAEAAAINESIGILERYSKSLQRGVDRTLVELERTKGAPLARSGASPAARGSATGLPSLASSLRVPLLEDALENDTDQNRQLQQTLNSKRQELARLDEARQHQLTELQGRLAQMRMVYTANHPSVLSLQQNIAALAAEPPQSRALATEIEELQAEYDKGVSDATDLQIKAELARRSAGGAASAPAARPLVPGTTPVDRSADSPMGQFATLQLRSELSQLQNVLERTDGARIELAVSQAAFKYRYTVISPAQVPRSPKFPDVRLIVAAGVCLSFFLALAIVVGKDLLSDRILEPWQVERQLGLRLLGT